MPFGVTPHASNRTVFGYSVPDFGISEAVQRTFAPNTAATADRGSNLFGAGSLQQVAPNDVNRITTPERQWTTGSGQVTGYGQQGYDAARAASGSVLGAQSPTTSGGGGFNTKDRNVNPGPGYFWDAADGWKPTGGGQDEYMSQINSVFDEVNSILGRQEDSARADLPGQRAQAGAIFDSYLPNLQAARDEGMRLNETQRGDVLTREQNALSDSRRLFGELSQANRQRYGGSSSAGQFADTILGRETQRNMGRIGQDTQQSLSSLQAQANQIDLGFANQKAELDRQKAGAIANVENLFQQRLNEIANARLGNAQNKANAQLQALAELRENARNIENFFRQQSANMMANAQNAALQLQTQIQSYRAAAGQPVDIGSIAQLGVSQFGGGQQDVLGPTAMANPSRRLRYDPLSGRYVEA